MKKYAVFPDRVQITFTDGRVQTIYLTKDSGKVYYRYKIDTISAVRHPGIYLGVDGNGTRWFMHNHISVGHPAVVPERAFTIGEKIYPSAKKYTNTPEQTIRRGLDLVIEGRSYVAMTFNCQSFVNLAANNVCESEDLDNWIGRVFVGLLVFAGIKAVIK